MTENYPPSAYVYYIRNIAQNFMREIKDKEHHNKIVNLVILLFILTTILSTNIFMLDIHDMR